ncbi:MAG TPA: glutamine synthetase family protein, partial [Myxococcota bacterium]|nr:glutamine synthetase family protein [Myxococcota bacterium]
PEEVITEIDRASGEKVTVAVTDIDGVLRGKSLHKEKFLTALRSGFGFCNVIFGWDCADVCYDNGSYTGWHSGYPDAHASIDVSTFRRVPWDGDTPFFLADFTDAAGEPLAVCPRQLLRRVIAEAAAMGFTASVGVEYEWFNFRETPQSVAEKRFTGLAPIAPGMFGYSLLRAGQHGPYLNALFEELRRFGVPLEGLHTETGPGVFEVAMLHADALEAADRGVLFKTAVKEIAYRFGIMPSFMAKWDDKLPGSGGHLHQSLWDDTGVNLFHDADHPHKMSSLLQQYLAGQMHCLPEILPMFAPNVNSYKRLVEGAWAPNKVTWGADNRTTALRVIPGSAKSTRLETRVGGADINAYLAVAAVLASGLFGIRHALKLTQRPVEGSAYHHGDAPRLPGNLADATARMARSEVARELFGSAFVEHFVRSREWEWRQFERAVTSWELQRYFEII